MRDGELHVAIAAEQRQTGRLLNQQISDLRTTLESQGIRVADVSVVQSRATVDGVQREALSALRGGQMDSGSNPNQQQAQQQAAFTGDFQRSPGQGESYTSDGQPTHGQAVNGRGGAVTAGVGGFLRSSSPAAGVDYYA
jgi:flagellar hook-length control protein FliK